MATYVLVHGAWGGAHGFRHVRRLLTAAGHDAFTPSLTGIGERVHLTSPQVGLGTHVDDVVNHVLYEDLQGIVLLGFSYGGMVVTGAVDHIGDRVHALVFLDAFLPADGQSLFDLTGQSAPSRTPGAAWLVPPLPRDYDDPAEEAFAAPRRTPQPIGCFTEPIRLARPLEDHPFSRTYIRATEDPQDNAAFAAAAAHARSSPAWRYHELATTHLVPHNRPGDLVDLLLQLA
jgi:pimeloyl-ACP methyl ester carboxylesterase